MKIMGSLKWIQIAQDYYFLLILILTFVAHSNQSRTHARSITCRSIHPLVINEDPLIGYMWSLDGPQCSH